MPYIQASDEEFDNFIQNLPNLLNNGWTMPFERQLTEKADERHFVCQYIGNEICKTLLFISLNSTAKNNQLHIISLSPTGDKSILSQKECVAILNHFQELIKNENVTLIISNE